MAIRFQHLILVGLVLCGAAFSKEWYFGEPFGPIAPNLKFIVNVDGKSFFADSNGRTWEEAGNYCRSLGMKLCSITSKTQAEALQNSYDSVDFGLSYWTSARDSQLTRQFSWNETGQEASSEYLTVLNRHNIKYLSCLYYLSLPNNQSTVVLHSCTAGASVLCET